MVYNGYTRVYKGILGYTRVYMGILGCTRVYMGILGCTRVYNGYTWVCNGYTWVYKGYTKGIHGVYRGYTKGIQRVYKGYTRIYRVFLGHYKWSYFKYLRWKIHLCIEKPICDKYSCPEKHVFVH